MSDIKPSPGDRVRFAGDGTRWTARAATKDGRYLVCTGNYRGQVCYLLDDCQAKGPLDDNLAAADRWHVVLVTDRRIECADGCGGPDPHMSEYRASDVQS